jgi:hypothetical protein
MLISFSMLQVTNMSQERSHQSLLQHQPLISPGIFQRNEAKQKSVNEKPNISRFTQLRCDGAVCVQHK